MLDLISFGEPEVAQEESGPSKQLRRFSYLQSTAYLGWIGCFSSQGAKLSL